MARLGDICTVVSGSTPKTSIPEYWDGDIKWITPAELNEESFYLYDSQRHITELGKDKTGLSYMPTGTVILSSRAPIGKTAIAGCEMCCNQGFKNLICSDAIFNEYLYYFLKGKTEYLNSLGRGATFKEISKAIVEEIEINLPAFAEQKQIAIQFGEVYRLIFLRKQQLAKLDELVKARFVELFGLPVSNSKKWDTEKMKDIAPAVNYSGGFEETVWLLNLDMVEAQTGRIIDYLYVSENEVGNSTCTFDTSNVLYSKLRPYLNKVVIPDRCGYATSEMIPLKPNLSKIERTYLAFMLRSDEFVKMINEKVAGAKMPRVSMSDFRDFNVPVPPMELQKQFAAFIEQTDKSKLAIQQNLDKLETLKKSLMQKYFG